MVINKDIVILGGGIAGLWLLHRLRAAGFHAALLERTALGHGQSIASQGMIHGGMKYALGGNLTGAAQTIADMPAQWKACLAGHGEVDLRGARLLSDTYYLWPRQSLRSRLNAFFGSKLVRGRVDRVAPGDYPAFFRGRIDGPLYRLQDIVLDVPSLLETLAQGARYHIHHVAWRADMLERDAAGGIVGLRLDDGRTLRAKRFIVAAGAGNEALIHALRPEAVAMQRRPLRMVIVRHAISEPLYVHCVSDQLTATPELTITTHHCRDGATAWYLGGELAERGVARDEAEQRRVSLDMLRTLFPWCDFTGADVRCFDIDRAEARQGDGKRPDGPDIRQHANALFCWPTKLTLAPVLGDGVLAALREQRIEPAGGTDVPLAGLPPPPVATPPWDET